jgi:peptidoglycan/xylan/chitin deacetylase (PgdA/CDA1 family)
MYRAPGVPILCYHSIDDSQSLMSVSPSLFSAQMQFLAHNGYRTIPLSELCKAVSKRRSLPEKAVALTFDDGFRNNLTAALPILQQFGFSATIFVVTGYVGRRVGWTRSPGIPDLELASWDEIRQLAEGGFEIGAHSVSHPNLCRLSSEEVRREIMESKQEIERQLDRPVTLFAYPYGELSAAVKEVVGDLSFAGAVTVDDGRTLPGDDPISLKRINVTGISGVEDSTRLMYFRCCVTGSEFWYRWLKARFPRWVNEPATPWREDA